MKLNKIITIIFVRMSPFQKFDHKLIFVILIRYINTKLLKSCTKNQKLLEVAKFGKSCSKRQKLPNTICQGLKAPHPVKIGPPPPTPTHTHTSTLSLKNKQTEREDFKIRTHSINTWATARHLRQIVTQGPRMGRTGRAMALPLF